MECEHLYIPKCPAFNELDAPGGIQQNEVLPVRATHTLRKGRQSIPGARYFLTISTCKRKKTLTSPDIAQCIINTWRCHHRDSDFKLQCATIMPDHIHLLCTLGHRLKLEQVIRKFKSSTKSSLAAADTAWQSNFYDHRILHDRFLESFAFYMFMNPYRKQLITHEVSWPFWVKSREYLPAFYEYLIGGNRPQPKWIEDPDPTGRASAC